MRKVTPHEFLRKPYTRILIPDEESGTFTAQITEFPGCIAQGDSPAEAYERLEAAAEAWIEAALEMQQDIPSPTAEVQQFSGRFALRLPRSLHREAARRAEAEGTSLNQFIVATLAEAVGFAKAVDYISQREEVLAMPQTRPAPQPPRIISSPGTYRHPTQGELLDLQRRSTH